MYYPKSQIQSNLITNGEEFVYVGTVVFYKGSYYKTSKGKYFTGNVPGDGDNLELEIFKGNIEEQETQTNEITILDSTYVKTLFTSNTLLLPVHLQPTPTQDEYTRGVFKRYFCKKTNQIQYLELDQNTYNNLNSKNPVYLWQNYLPFSLDWILTGDELEVSKTNQYNVRQVSKQFFLNKFGDFLKNDYLKYYK